MSAPKFFKSPFSQPWAFASSASFFNCALSSGEVERSVFHRSAQMSSSRTLFNFRWIWVLRLGSTGGLDLRNDL